MATHMNTVGGRTVNIIKPVCRLLHLQRAVECQRIADAASVAFGSNDADIGKFRRHPRQNGYALRRVPVVIGNQDVHCYSSLKRDAIVSPPYCDRLSETLMKKGHLKPNLVFRRPFVFSHYRFFKRAMRLSKEGCVLSRESLASLAIPIAFICSGKSLVLPFKRCSAAIILCAPTNLAAPASARYSR